MTSSVASVKLHHLTSQLQNDYYETRDQVDLTLRKLASGDILYQQLQALDASLHQLRNFSETMRAEVAMMMDQVVSKTAS